MLLLLVRLKPIIINGGEIVFKAAKSPVTMTISKKIIEIDGDDLEIIMVRGFSVKFKEKETSSDKYFSLLKEILKSSKEQDKEKLL